MMRPTDTLTFTGLDALLALLENEPPQPWAAKIDAKYSKARDWNFNTSAADAIALARHGWPAGWAKVSRLADAITATTDTTERWTPFYDVAGDEADLGRFVAGEPENMVEFRPVRVAAPSPRFVRVSVCASVSCAVSTDAIQRRGAAICALVDLLEASGARVELESFFGSRDGLHTACYRVPLKAFGDQLDRDRAAMLIIHPAGLRQLLFGAYTRLVTEKTFDSAYGLPWSPDTAPGELQIPAATGSMPEWQSDDSARAWVIRQLQAQGVEVETK